MNEKIKKMKIGQCIQVILKDKTEYNTLRIEVYKYCIESLLPPFKHIKITKNKGYEPDYTVERVADYKSHKQIRL